MRSSLAPSGRVTNSPAGSSSATPRARVDLPFRAALDQYPADRRIDRGQAQRQLQFVGGDHGGQG